MVPPHTPSAPEVRSGRCYFGTQTLVPLSSVPGGQRRFASADPANITVRNDSAMTAAKIFFAIHSPPLVIPSIRAAFDHVPDVGNPDARCPDTERRADVVTDARENSVSWMVASRATKPLLIPSRPNRGICRGAFRASRYFTHHEARPPDCFHEPATGGARAPHRQVPWVKYPNLPRASPFGLLLSAGTSTFNTHSPRTF